MPRDFAYPSGQFNQRDVRVVAADRDRREHECFVEQAWRAFRQPHDCSAQPSADSARVATAMRMVEDRLAKAYPEEQGHWTSAFILPIRDEVSGT